MVMGVLVGLAAFALGIYMFVERSGGEPWFFWISPLLSLGFGALAWMLVVQYYLKVGRLAIKGRPRK
jgi:hypothetical protein